MSNAPAEQLVWIDCEMTGLDIENDGLVEIAVIITDFELNLLHPGLALVMNPGDNALANMGEFVRTMHEASGLLPEIAAGMSVADAEAAVIAYIDEHVPGPRRPILAGNTIGMDRAFIMRYMPALDDRLHYRNLDVSSVKELSRRWFPSSYFCAPEKNGGHRALADIQESIRELAYYRKTVFVDGTGPASADAKRFAQETVDEFDAKL
jgi:oligoribonuclease